MSCGVPSDLAEDGGRTKDGGRREDDCQLSRRG
jgi:hypothetical protein